MDIYKIDYTKKENQTFKKWFKLMFFSGYLPLFILGIVMTIALGLTKLENKSDYIFMIIPILVSLVVGYKGLYQYWNNLKSGK